LLELLPQPQEFEPVRRRKQNLVAGGHHRRKSRRDDPFYPARAVRGKILKRPVSALSMIRKSAQRFSEKDHAQSKG
jgi:hypothetical protein